MSVKSHSAPLENTNVPLVNLRQSVAARGNFFEISMLFFFFCTQDSDHAIGQGRKKVTIKLVTIFSAEVWILSFLISKVSNS